MKITRKSTLTGIVRSRDIDVTAEQIQAWVDGVLIQDAMPHLNVDDREFIMTGIILEEWDNAYPGE